MHPFGKSWASVFSLHHPEGYPIPHPSTGKGQDKESDPAQHLSRARSARESRTTWLHWRTRPGSPGIWSAAGTVCTGAQCAHLHQPYITKQTCEAACCLWAHPKLYELQPETKPFSHPLQKKKQKDNAPWSLKILHLHKLAVNVCSGKNWPELTRG